MSERADVLRSVRAWLFGEDTGHGPSEDRAPAAETAHTAGSTGAGTSADPEPALESERAPAEPAGGSHNAAVVASRQERAAERLLEDERLRGDLTDDEFQPLLDWALAASDALAAGTTGLPDHEADTAIEAGLGQIKDGVRTAGAAIAAMLDAGAETRDAELARLAELAAPPLVSENAGEQARARLGAALEPITADPDLAGQELATALGEVLRAINSATCDKDGPAA